MRNPGAPQTAAGEAGRIELAGPLTLRTVEEGHRKLIEAIGGHEALEIDCSAMAEVDLSGAQLLIAALKSARAAGKPVTFTCSMPGTLRDVLSGAGLIDAFVHLAAETEISAHRRADTQ